MSLSRLLYAWIIAQRRRSVKDHNTSLEGQHIYFVYYLDTVYLQQAKVVVVR